VTSFKDHFSGHAGDYARFRPQYPADLYRHLVSLCNETGSAWDCATGNGQAAVVLAEYFDQVIATDASELQVSAAQAHPGVSYRCAPAEQSGLPSSSVDLISVAQALHWFDIDAFLREAARVLKPGGVLAVWSYDNYQMPPDISVVTERIFAEVEDYWPPERLIVARRYRDIELPWDDIVVPSFEMMVEWDINAVLGYMRTWSATKRYEAALGSDPIGVHEIALRAAWGTKTRTVCWPLTLRATRRD
jgi:SAM-dependent methyltransferase